MSLAARTRETVARRPALRIALAAGAVNHTAAARLLADDVGADPDDHDAVAAALRRHADRLRLEREDAGASVRMVTGVGLVAADETDADDRLLSVGDRAVLEDAGERTALVVEGTPDGRGLQAALSRLAAEGIAVDAAGTCADRAVVVVGRRAGADALRAVEDALQGVPRVVETE